MIVLSIQAHGTTLQLNDTGGKIARCYRRGYPYERFLLEHIYDRRHTLAGTALDVGANIGNHALWFAGVCGFDVVAYEPLHHQILREHAELNQLAHKIVIEPVALGDHNNTAVHIGKGRLADTDQDVPINDQPDVASGKWLRTGARVPVRRLDDYNLEHVSLIKIDVEGMEPAVLRGGEKMIRRDRPVIFAEEWDKDPSWHQGIAQVLEPWGYTMTKIFKGKESPTPVGRWEHE
jgi:FkbM family methyltransferase